MNLLKTSPVVIIDDEEAEAMPVMRALGRLGVGCVYIPGDRVEQLPDPPIGGVRLVFMDMQLGTQGSSRQIGAQAANVFRRSIDANAVPLVIVLWTKHEEHVQEFEKALYEGEPRFKTGTLVMRLEKPHSASDIDFDGIKNSIEALINKCSPLQFIWTWEQLAHEAAVQTSNKLGELVQARVALKTEVNNRSDEERLAVWLDAARHVLRCLIDVAAGQNLNSETAYRDAIEVLAPLHQDRLEQEIIGRAGGDFSDVLGINWEGPSLQEEAATNSMLLVAPVHPDDMAVRPGNLYMAQADLAESCLHTMCRVNAERIGRDVLRPTKDESYRQLNDKVEKQRNCQQSGNDINTLENARDVRFRELLEKCKPVLMEITPACDYAQRKRQVRAFHWGPSGP